MTQDFTTPWATHAHDRDDPDPFHAMWLDRSVPLDDDAKAAVLEGQNSRIRQFVLPFVRPMARITIVLFQILKVAIPGSRAPRLLHWLLRWGLEWFVRPQANWLILRHFHIGSEIMAFIRCNSPYPDLPADPLKPKALADVADNLFVRHDLNLYNFVIDLNQRLRDGQRQLSAPAHVDYSMITDGSFDIAPLPRRWCNLIDLETAIDIFTPIYQLLLSDRDFWRACNSLQLDETMAIYSALIRGRADHLFLVNNKHPLVPLTTLRAGHRLMLHGMAAECLHYQLRLEKRRAATGPIGATAGTT